MRVSTRIAGGYAVLILLTIAVLSYQAWIIRQMNRINTEFADMNVGQVSVALTGLKLQSDQADVEEFAGKVIFTQDPDFLKEFRAYVNDMQADLKKLQNAASSERQHMIVDRLMQSLRDLQSLSVIPRVPHGNPPPKFKQLTLTMRMDEKELLESVKEAIQKGASRSSAAAARAAEISKFTAAAAVMLSVLVALPIVWSIVSRLREMAAATHLVAAGKFEHRLPVKGNDEFASLAKDFNTMSRRLGELDQLKKDFVSHVSHDLKGPLASTRETVNLLMAEIPGPLNEKQRRLLELCLKSSQRLSAMIGNLLDVSRMEAGMLDYKFELLDLLPLVRNIVAEFEGLAREKKMEIAVEANVPEIWVNGDPARIAQVIGNLVENAIKFSPAAARTLLRIEGRGNIALLSVWDRGPGVPEEFRERIFDRFLQVNPEKKSKRGEGVGLGLSICKTIVEAHGGAIWVEDNPEGGSVFYVKIRSSERRT